MTSTCDHNRELMAADSRRVRPWSETVEAHIASCAECEAWAVRLELHARALGELEAVSAPAALVGRLDASFKADHLGLRAAEAVGSLARAAAPADLEGRVVASMHGGVREKRVISELLHVSGPGAPVDLDRRMEDLFVELRSEGLITAPDAPEELAELVDQDLADLPGTITSRLLGKLERLVSPVELEARVDADLAQSQAAPAPILEFTRSLFSKQRVLVSGMAAAASLALWMGLSGPGSTPNTAPNYNFAVVEAESASEFTGSAQEFFNGASGGVLQSLDSAELEAPEIVDWAAPGSPLSPQNMGGAGGGTRPAAVPGGFKRVPANPQNGANGTSPTTTSQLGAGAPPLFDQVATAPLTHVTRGVRLVQLQIPQGDYATMLEYREEVATDGAGHFTIVPLDVINPSLSGMDLETFLMLQVGREGFFFRSRDFSVRNSGLFDQNYLITDLGLQMNVAGTVTSVFDVRRHDDTGSLYRVGLDTATGMLLFMEETSTEGVLISRISYESFAYNVDLSDIELAGGPSAWVPFSVGNTQSYSFELMRPTAPPSGFNLLSAGTLSGFAPSGDTWARLVYGDGVEQVFFAFSTAVPNRDGQQVALGSMNDRVRVLEFASWTMIEGLVGGREILVIGKADQDALLMMLQSALEQE